MIPYSFGIYGISGNLLFYNSAGRSFKNRLLQEGYKLTEEMHEMDFLVCVDSPVGGFKLFKQKDLRKVKKIFIRMEPEVVWPYNSNPNLNEIFDIVIDFGRIPNDQRITEKWPQEWHNLQLSNPLEGSLVNKVVLINSNKISLIKGELYSLRRDCIRNFPEVDFYGKDWDLNFGKRVLIFLRTFKFSLRFIRKIKFEGIASWFLIKKNNCEIVDKFTILKEYKYSLVIENSLEVMTEKIFDCFFSSTIPIYVGPDLNLLGIPPNLYIQCGPSISEIQLAFQKAKLIDYNEWVESLNSWINSTETRGIWGSESILDKFVHALTKLH